MKKYKPNLGDKVFTRNDKHSGLSRIITWATSNRGEGHSLCSHVGTFLDDEYVVEAMFPQGIVRHLWEDRKTRLLQDGGEYCILQRRSLLHGCAKEYYIKFLFGTIGRDYGWTEIPLQFLDAMLSKLFGRDVIFFRRLGDINPYTIVCSQASSIPDIKIGDLPVEARYWSPDDLYDYLIKTKGWSIIDHSANWYGEFIKELKPNDSIQSDKNTTSTANR